MSGGNSGSGGQVPGQSNTYQTQQTNSTTEPSPVIQQQLKDLVGGVGGYTAGGFTPPSLFPGSMTPDPSQATKSYWESLAQQSVDRGLLNAGSTYATDTLGGKYLNLDNNPYWQKGLAAGFAPQTKLLNDVTIPNLRSQFAGSGRTSYTPEGADFDTTNRAVTDLDQAQANAAATATSNVYGMERGLQNSALQSLPNLQNMAYQNIDALGRAGAGIDQLNQAKLNEAIFRDTYNKTGGLDWLTKLAQTYQGIYPGGTTSGNGTSSGYGTYMPPSNPTASAVGAGMTGAGTILQFLPFFKGGLV
jgi:hypothetical protein